MSIIKNSDKNSESELPNNHPQSLDFRCEYSRNIPEILKRLNISLAFTSYQAGRLMIVRSDGESLDVNYKSFRRPMGLAVTESGLTLGVFTQVINFGRVDGLVEQLKKPLQKIEDDVTAPRIKPKETARNEQSSADEIDTDKQLSTSVTEPLQSLDNASESANNPSDTTNEKVKTEASEERADHYLPVDDRVDACFISRSSHFTGMINLHDIDWGDDGLWVVNSSFSCLCTLDADYSFVPRWKPFFISELVPEDRCHLNGMTLKDGRPGYVTTFSTCNEVIQWRKQNKQGGTLMSVVDNEIVVEGLTMPHSPRWYQNSVYFCNSGLGLFCQYQPETQQVQTIAELPGFTRGVDFYGPIAFVGLSKIRHGDVLHAPPLLKKDTETFSGIWLLDLSTGEEIGHIKFTGNVDQIYDVAVVPGCSFPELLEPSHPRMRNHFVVAPLNHSL